MANLITSLRIVWSICLLFVPTFSSSFYSLYFLCGCSDILDGFVARKLNTVSDFGSKLDTLADIVFFVVCVFKFIDYFIFPIWIWIWIGIILIVKMSSMILCKGIVNVHSILNKVTGFFLFILPFMIRVIPINYYVIFVCFLAFMSSIHERLLIQK